MIVIFVCIALVDGFAKEEIVLELDVLCKVIPQTGFQTFAAWFFTAVDDAGHDQSI